jgi:uncharacterized protein YbjQ (UPF0145 family)
VDPNLIALTTAPGIDGYRVARTLDIVMGGGMFEQRIWGDVLRGAKVTAMNEVRQEAAQLGANAVIAVTLVVTVESGYWVVVASGTAVQLEKAV